MSCRFRRSIDGPAGICLRGKHNQCHTAIALGAQKEAKKGAVFVLHFLTVHSRTAPKQGPYFGPCFGTEAGMGVKKFGGVHFSPWAASLLQAGYPWQVNVLRLVPSVLEIVAPISSSLHVVPKLS